MLDIAGRKIGPGEPCYVIAEAGVAHGGDIATALKLVDAAKRVGADAVKFQTFNTARLLTPDSPMYRTLLPLELSHGHFCAIKAHCDDVGITFLSTPDQEADADFLDELVPAFKAGSGNLRNLPFLRHVATKGKPIILSTGMATMEDVLVAVNEIQAATYGATPLAILHCASVYPDCEDAHGRYPDPSPWNLRAIESLQQFGYPVGYSDHSRVPAAASAAIALGACIYEAHIALDGYHGIDAGVSQFPEALGYIVDSIRWQEAALGDGVKRPMPGEERTREYVETWKR